MTLEYYCHVCNAFISPSQIRHVQDDEVYCNVCNRPGFVEKMDRNDSFFQSYRRQPRPYQPPNQDQTSSTADAFLDSFGVSLQQMANNLYSSFFSPIQNQTISGNVTRGPDNNDFNGMQYFQFDLNLGGPSTQQFPGNDFMSIFRQIVMNPDDNAAMNQIIQYIMENDTNRQGSPPAAVKVVKNMKEHILSKEESEGLDSCAVCHEKYQEGDKVHYLSENRELCNHCFHVDCIIPWLKEHNSCPVCRFELPTDDPDYDARRADLRERIAQQVSQAAQASRSDGGNRSRSSSQSTAPPTRTDVNEPTRTTAPNIRVQTTTRVTSYSTPSQPYSQPRGYTQSFLNQYTQTRRMVPLSFDPLDAMGSSRRRQRQRSFRSTDDINNPGCPIQ